MALKSIQLCHIDAVDRARDKFTVTINSDDGQQQAIFRCDSEDDARKLRNAIRDHAVNLKRVYALDR